MHEVMEAIPSWEAALKTRRLEKESLELQAREAAARRLAVAREQEVLRRQRARLVADLVAWERADRLRRFISAIQEASSQHEEGRAWLNWAQDQVRGLDPLCSRFSAVTSLDVRLEEHFTGHPAWEEPAKDWWDQ